MTAYGLGEAHARAGRSGCPLRCGCISGHRYSHLRGPKSHSFKYAALFLSMIISKKLQVCAHLVRIINVLTGTHSARALVRRR